MLDNWGYQHIVSADLLSSRWSSRECLVFSRVTNIAHEIQSSSCKLSSLQQTGLEKKTGLCDTKLTGLWSCRTLLWRCEGTAFDNGWRCREASFQSGTWKTGLDCLTCIWWQSCPNYLSEQKHNCKHIFACRTWPSTTGSLVHGTWSTPKVM